MQFQITCLCGKRFCLQQCDYFCGEKVCQRHNICNTLVTHEHRGNQNTGLQGISKELVFNSCSRYELSLSKPFLIISPNLLRKISGDLPMQFTPPYSSLALHSTLLNESPNFPSLFMLIKNLLSNHCQEFNRKVPLA